MTAQTILPANSVTGGYDVENSLRFNDDSSDYLSQTYSSSGNQRTFTISFWFKRSNVVSGNIYTYQDASNEIRSEFILVSNTLKIVFNPTGSQWSSDMIVQENGANYLFRDHSAWYHVVMAIDTTQGTEANRIKVYVNGDQKTMSAYPTENFDTGYNTDIVHSVGSYIHAANTFFDGYLAEFCVIDGSQLAADQFGEFDSDSGIWKPIDGLADDLTFGTNGFYLEFKQSGTSANSSGMGADTSGNDHHFTVHNLTAIDQSTDTCTNNFATFNRLTTSRQSGGVVAYSEGNTKIVTAYSNTNYLRYPQAYTTLGVTSGKWYAEFKIGAIGSASVGIANTGEFGSDGTTNPYAGYAASGAVYTNGGEYRANNSSTGSQGTYTEDDIIGCALDMDNLAVYWHKNGTYINSGDPTSGSSKTGARAVLTPTTPGGFYVFTAGADNTGIATIEINLGSPSYAISSGNADARGHGNFEYAVPSGYFALCTKNLAEFG